MKIHRGFLSSLLKYLFLIALSVVVVYPILYIFFASFKSNSEILVSGIKLLPEKFLFSNYQEAWVKGNFKQYTMNSIQLSFFSVLGAVVSATVCGYVFERGRFPGRGLIFGVIVSTMFIGVGSINIFPQVKVAGALGIDDGLWGVILIRVFGMSVTSLFLARSFIRDIPTEIDEAAKIDGCGFFGIYYRIILPLLKPLIATVGLLSFKDAWNDYLMPMVFTIASPQQRPLVVGVLALKASGEGTSSAWNLMLAGTSLSVVPIIVVYLFLNRYFISGLTDGAVKG